MNITIDQHPSLDSLRAFAEGRLSSDAMNNIGDHVESCDHCADRVDQWHVDPETLLFNIKCHHETHVPLRELSGDSVKSLDNIRTEDPDEKLQLLDVIGSGGMGLVYRALQPALNRHVAVKLLHMPLPQNDKESLRATERFQREIRALGRVRHAHLAQIYTSGVTSEGRLFYSMELINGANLAQIYRSLVQQIDQSTSEFSWYAAVEKACPSDTTTRVFENHFAAQSDTGYVVTVVEIIRQIALAVQCLHDSGIVHRDIKPGNIMVSASGDHATLMDLGLAGLGEDQEVRLTGTGLIAGSLPYISPEQFRGQPPSEAGDIYNLGVVLWELLALKRLFGDSKKCSDAEMMHRILHTEPSSLQNSPCEVLPGLEAIVLKCLEKCPEQRYATVVDFVEDLDRCRDGRRVTAGRNFRWRKLTRLVQQNKKLATGLLMFLVMQCFFLVAIIFRTKGVDSAIDVRPTEKSLVQVAPVINDGTLVAQWSAGGTGTAVNDSSRNGNHGALVGDTTRVPSRFGSGFSFDGQADYVHFGRASKWNFLHDGSPFTIAGHVAPAAGNIDGGILATIDEQSTAANRHGFALRLRGNRQFEFMVQGEGGAFPLRVGTKQPLTTDEHIPIAVTFDGRLCRMYVNGEWQAACEPVAPFVASTALDALSLGSIGTTGGPNGQAFSPFTGIIDEMQIYNRAMNAAEVRFLAGRATAVSQRTRLIRPLRSMFSIQEGPLNEGAAAGTSIEGTYAAIDLGAPFPAFPTTHTGARGDAFLTAASVSASLHYDLGAAEPVNEIRIWNFHGGVYGLEGNGRGAKKIRVYASNDPQAFEQTWHDSWELITAFTAARAPADGARTPYGEEHRFTECTARFLRLQLDNNYGATNVGLAEVQFLNRAVEP